MKHSFIFVRHGQSQANADGIIADAQAPLTQNGIDQARRTASEVRTFNVTTIACSPYIRAQQTAATIAGELGVDLANIQVIEELRERGLGECEGRTKDHPSEWYSQADAPTLETKQDLLDRMQVALEKLDKLQPEIGKVLVVGHAISGFYLLEAAHGVKTVAEIGPDAQIGNADFVEISLKPH